MTTRSLDGGAVRALILMPALLTMFITLLRLSGELMNWSPALFDKTPGGGGALIGISWLIPVFGIYFALKLSDSGWPPASVGRALLMAFLAAVIGIGSGVVAGRLWGDIAGIVTISIVGLGSIALAYRGWPALGKTLVAYGLAARVPVAIVMLLAILGDWGTHYDVAPPDFPVMGPLKKWVWIGLVPQLTLWIFLTVVGGMIAGSIAVAFTARQAASGR
jgi:hypothetical protein